MKDQRWGGEPGAILLWLSINAFFGIPYGILMAAFFTGKSVRPGLISFKDLSLFAVLWVATMCLHRLVLVSLMRMAVERYSRRAGADGPLRDREMDG